MTNVSTLTTTDDDTASPHRLEEMNLPTLRRLLVNERARLRALQAQVRVARAWAEQECIAARGGDPRLLGSTQQDRERALILFLDAHPSYQQLSLRLADQERTVEAVQAEIEAARDARRLAEAERWDRYTQALVELAGAPGVAAAATLVAPGISGTHA